MTTHRIIDAVLYAFINYIAYFPLVMYPFRNKYKYSKLLSYSITGVLCLGFVAMNILVVAGWMPAYMIPILSISVAGVVMYIGIRELIGKTFMTLLIVYNIATLVTVLAKNLEVFFFPNRAHELYCWTHSIFIFVGVVITYILDGWYTIKIYDKMMNMPNNSRFWKVLWICPASYYFGWFVYTSTSPHYIHGTLEKPSILLLLTLYSLGGFLTYYVLSRLVFFEADKYRLEYSDLLLQSQYNAMSERVEQTRKSRHDLRHHFVVLNAFAEQGDIDGIREYMEPFKKKYETEDTLVYCEHQTVNSLIAFHANQAKNEGVLFSAKVDLPDDVCLTDKDLTIIFGNLLENALHACRKVTDGQPYIRLNCRVDDNGILMKLRNSTSVQPKQDGQGRFISTSHRGYGIGISSVKSVVETFDGIFNCGGEGDYFQTSIFIPCSRHCERYCAHHEDCPHHKKDE